MSFTKAGPLTDASQATPSWLASALAEGGIDLAAADIEGVTSEPLGIGRGNLGGLARLRWTSKRVVSGDVPASLVIKFAPPGVSSLVRSWRLGRRETLYYRTFGGQGPMRAPRCYFADCNERSGDFTLLLEDLGAAATPDQGVGASLPQAEVAIDQLARHHAHFWQAEALASNAEWLLLPNANREAFSFFVKRGWRTCAKHYPDLPTSTDSALAALERSYGAALDRASAAPVTLLHGDFRLDNMFFQSAAWSAPFAVADWQLVGQGKGPWDVAHFLVGSLTTEMRVTHGHDLLKRYFALVEPVAGAAYSFADCVADYDAGMIGSFTVAAVLVDMQLRASGTLAPVMEDWLRRSSFGTIESLSRL